MHLRLSTVRRDQKTYRYAQLVESYRRPEDGRPTHRIIASLGALSDEAIANIRSALEANRSGEALVMPPKQMAKPVVRANYRFLDIAVLLRLWKESGLAGLLADLFSSSQTDIATDQVISALVVNRCVEAGSKLAAWRWFPKTALPELLRVTPEQFNNSRIHRALEALELVDSRLQARLPAVIQASQGASVRLFIDATDTWFVGEGPPLAAKGIDKRGHYRRRVGIVLLCDQRGFPLRWETLGGQYHDATALLDMAVDVGRLDWVGERPVVLDRAVGNAAAVEKLLRSGIRFVTALPWTEFAGSGAPIPWDKVATLQAACLLENAGVDSIASCGAAQGFEHPRPDRFLLDLGVFNKTPSESCERDSRAKAAMRFAIQTEQDNDTSRSAQAESAGISIRGVQKHRELLRLGHELQLRVLAGAADALPFRTLVSLACLPISEQVQAFDEAIAPKVGRVYRALAGAPGANPAGVRTRGVLYFNPTRFLEKRDADARHVEQVEAEVVDLNRRLAVVGNRRSDGSALAAAHKRIVSFGLGAVMAPRLDKSDGLRRVVIDQDEIAWRRRRQAYGLAVLVTHPEVQGTPSEVVDLYFEKDVIEKDFHTIKSAIELRPVHHRTDIKLRAHVTMCMLALLVQRMLKERLKVTEPGTSAVAALEELETVHLNRVASGNTEFHTVTELTARQQRLLTALNMDDLAQPDRVAATITPR